MKIISIILMVLIIVTLTGCPDEKTSEKTPPLETGTAEPQPETGTPAPTSEVPPATEQPKSTNEPTEDEQSQSGRVIGTYSTKIVDKKANRVSNINTAIKSLNGKEIAVGEQFSFNTVVGPRTPERGYKQAYIFKGKEKLMGYGGGICQLSTTIYNAAMDSGVEIIERHPHERKVDYAPEGKDATVSYGNQDMVFKNNKQYTITLKVINQNDHITVDFVRK